MYELRQDITTGQWVLIATDRAKRPQTFVSKIAQDLPVHDPSCPFCPGNEAMTPPEIPTMKYHVDVDDPRRRIRVIPNKYPAVIPDPPGACFAPSRCCLPGKGRHEVVIETPEHNLFFGDYDDRHVGELLMVIRDRVATLKQLPDVRSVIVFKNSGPKSGVSLIHPHGQIVALPMAPPLLLRRMELLKDHRHQTGTCLICHFIERELAAGARILDDHGGFVTLHPCAPRTPYETWILPRDHTPVLERLTDDACFRFALAIRNAVSNLGRFLGDLDFNLTLIDESPAFDAAGIFHIYAVLSPRMSAVAGFEMGTGMFMNTHGPEATARLIREFMKRGEK